MDLFKKFFGLNQNPDELEKNSNQPKMKDEFRKPIWIEDYETDDDLLERGAININIFANSESFEKQFEEQVNEIMKAFEKEESIFAGNNIKRFEMSDRDLDGEDYSDQLNFLLQRISPELNSFLPQKLGPSEIPREHVKRTEQETIMDRIHGTYSEPESSTPIRRRISKLPVQSNININGNFPSGPKIFGQSVITQTIRKPDGSQETRRFTKDSHGNAETTITILIDGKETVTTYGNNAKEQKLFEGAPSFSSNSELNPIIKKENTNVESERNIVQSKFGYILPKNLW